MWNAHCLNQDLPDYCIFFIHASPSWNNRTEVLGFADILECLSILKLQNFLCQIRLVFTPAQPNLCAKSSVPCDTDLLDCVWHPTNESCHPHSHWQV